MTLEQSLAARKIADMLARGASAYYAVHQAMVLLMSQGFSKEHSRKVAAEMLEQVI